MAWVIERAKQEKFINSWCINRDEMLYKPRESSQPIREGEEQWRHMRNGPVEGSTVTLRLINSFAYAHRNRGVL